MRVAIDARWIFREISGIGRYTQELLQALAEVDPETDYRLLFCDPEVRDRVMGLDAIRAAPRMRAETIPWGLFSPLGQLRLPGWLRRQRIDLFHSTNYMIPLAAFPPRRPGRVRCAVTLHDLIPLVFPDHAPRSKKARLFPLYRWLMREGGRRADLILTVSESSRRDILEHLAIPAAEAGKVTVTPEGVSPGYQAGPEPAPGQTFLYVGRFDPYKNVPLLVEAFARVRAREPGARLRLIGPPDPRYPEARDTARRLGLGDEVVTWQGYVDHEELVRAYRDARALVLPSTYEGFGLTVLEAMACGTPVICSNVSSLPEVAGDAACLIDPRDPVALAEAMLELLRNPAEAARLRAAGLERVRAFTWQRTAEATAAAYRQVAGTTA